MLNMSPEIGVYHRVGQNKQKEEIAGVRVYYAEHVSRDRGVPKIGTDKQKEEIAGVRVNCAEHVS